MWTPRQIVEYATRETLDLTSADLRTARRWRDYGAIVNAAAYTAVDAAESADGRAAAWAVNAAAVARLAAVAAGHGITLVHISSDYAFDGASDHPYREDDLLAPLGVYGQTKAAGDLAAATAPRHYVLRTSWVIGDGKNFVSTMRSLAERGIDPAVVDDQIGRLTFTDDLAAAAVHLLESRAAYGVDNVTGGGDSQSWADIAREVFRLTGHDSDRVTGITSAQYFANATGPVAPRPRNSLLDLAKITATGFRPRDHMASLAEYLAD